MCGGVYNTMTGDGGGGARAEEGTTLNGARGSKEERYGLTTH